MSNNQIGADLAHIKAAQAQQGLDIANIQQSLVMLPKVMNGFDMRLGGIEAIVKEAITEALAPVMDEFRREVRKLEQGQQSVKAHVDKRIAEITKRLDDDEARLDTKRARLDAHDIELAELRARLDARPSPEEARATYEGVQQIRKYLGLNDDASSGG